MPSTDAAITTGRTPSTARPRGLNAGARACAAGALCAALLAGAAAGAQAQVPGGPSTPPLPPPPPIAAPVPPDPPAPAPQPPLSAGELPPKLTQIYRGDDGGALYLRAEGTTVVGYAEHPGRKYAFVFRGTRTKDVINGSWYDVAKGTRRTTGTITLKVFEKGDKLVRSAGSDFGPDVFRVIEPDKVPWPGAREAGFQSITRSDLDGAFVGKSNRLEPDGSRLYWSESATGAVGVAEGAPPKGSKRPAWVSVYFGKRTGSDGTWVTGNYFDVPKGTATQRGGFTIIPLNFGRRYLITQGDSKSQTLTGRPTRIEADYALDFDKIAADVDEHFRDKVVGFAYAISSDGKVVRSGGGGSAYLSETKKGFDVNRPYTDGTESGIASSTKLITATAVMRELEKRGMSVDSQVATYFPSCWKLGPKMESLTFRRLLDHSSGIFRPDKDALMAQDSSGYLFEKGVAEGGLTGLRGYENQNYVMLAWILAGLLDKEKVEASFDKHGCGKATKAFDEARGIFANYVLDMLGDQGVKASWNFVTKIPALRYNFSDQSLPGVLPPEHINPTGGLRITADELGEFMAKLEHGRFVKRATVQAMKDGELGFDDVKGRGPDGGGPANSFLAWSGLGLADMKNGSCGNDRGRGCGSQLTMMPGDVQIVAIFNSRNNATTPGNHTALRRAWQAGIK